MRCILSVGGFVILLALAQSIPSKSVTTAIIQNRDGVQKLYGKPVREVYQTSGDLTISAEFAPNGNLCQAHIGAGSDAGITDAQLNPVLDELAPKDVRGEHKIDTFLNVACLKLVKPKNSPSSSKGELAVDPCITCSGVSEDYERVKITKYGNTNQYTSVHIAFRGPECKELDKAR